MEQPAMREQVVALLGQILHNNVGNRLTDELATGIVTSLNHHLRQVEAQPAAMGGGLPTLEQTAAE